MQRQPSRTAEREPPPRCASPSEDAIVAKFVKAYESADIDALKALLTDDAFISMPPMPFEYEGRDVVTAFCANLFRAGQRPARVRGLSARPYRYPPGSRPHRSQPDRPAYLCHDSFREQRARLVRTPCIASEQIA